MLTLEEFNRRLSSEFNGRLRARYVQHRDEYHIEQRVGKAVIPPFRINSGDDDAIRARDGYGYVMTIRRGDRMPCPDCGLTLKVPVMRTAEVNCDYCKVKGRSGSFIAAYYPLGDALIQHLRSIDPLLGRADERSKLLDAYNQALMDRKHKDMMNIVESGAHETYRQVIGIPQFGYTSAKHWFDKRV